MVASALSWIERIARACRSSSSDAIFTLLHSAASVASSMAVCNRPKAMRDLAGKNRTRFVAFSRRPRLRRDRLWFDRRQLGLVMLQRGIFDGERRRPAVFARVWAVTVLGHFIIRTFGRRERGGGSRRYELPSFRMLQCSMSATGAIVLFAIIGQRRKLCFENQDIKKYYRIAAALWSFATAISTRETGPAALIRRQTAHNMADDGYDRDDCRIADRKTPV